MSTLHVCPLSRLQETVTAARAGRLVTLIGGEARVERPAFIPAERHLVLGVSDIVEPLDGHVLAGEEHMAALLSFVRDWDRADPLVIHCWAGVSRSTAAAFIAACALSPAREEARVAQILRAASPTATPNARLVALADKMLGRRGRMSEAIAAIGRGASTMEGEPFILPLED